MKSLIFVTFFFFISILAFGQYTITSNGNSMTATGSIGGVTGTSTVSRGSLEKALSGSSSSSPHRSSSSNSSSNRTYYGTIEGINYYDWYEYKAALADKESRTFNGYTFPTKAAADAARAEEEAHWFDGHRYNTIERAQFVRQAYIEGRLFANIIYDTRAEAEAARAEEYAHWFDGRRYNTKEQAESAHYFKGNRYNSFSEIERATKEYNTKVQDGVNYLVNGGGKEVVYTNNTNSPLKSSRPIVYQPNNSSISPSKSSRPIVNPPVNEINTMGTPSNRPVVYQTNQVNVQSKRDPNDVMLDEFEVGLSKNQYLEDWKKIGMAYSGFSYGILEEGANLFIDQFNLGYKLLGPYYFLDPRTSTFSLLNTSFINDMNIVGEEFSWGAIGTFSTLDNYKGYAISIANPIILSYKNTLSNFLHGNAENRGRAAFIVGKTLYDFYGIGRDLSNPSNFLEKYSKKSAFGKLSDAYEDASTLTSPITDQTDKNNNDNNSK